MRKEHPLIMRLTALYAMTTSAFPFHVRIATKHVAYFRMRLLLHTLDDMSRTENGMQFIDCGNVNNTRLAELNDIMLRCYAACKCTCCSISRHQHHLSLVIQKSVNQRRKQTGNILQVLLVVMSKCNVVLTFWTRAGEYRITLMG